MEVASSCVCVMYVCKNAFNLVVVDFFSVLVIFDNFQPIFLACNYRKKGIN